MKTTFILGLTALLLVYGCNTNEEHASTADVPTTTPVPRDTVAPAKDALPRHPRSIADKKASPTDKKKLAMQPSATPPADNAPDPDPNAFVAVDTDAQPQNEAQVKSAIQYPADAKAEGVKGTVYLKILVDAAGRYKSHIVRNSPDARLTAAVVAQIKKLRYTPATSSGKPIKVWVGFDYSFS